MICPGSAIQRGSFTQRGYNLRHCGRPTLLPCIPTIIGSVAIRPCVHRIHHAFSPVSLLSSLLSSFSSCRCDDFWWSSSWYASEFCWDSYTQMGPGFIVVQLLQGVSLFQGVNLPQVVNLLQGVSLFHGHTMILWWLTSRPYSPPPTTGLSL